jgi:ADP-heptose:LPS heptosyltransferase
MLRKPRSVQLADNEILLIHLGGLGDVCLSESAFLSLRNHFGNTIVAVGTKRFFHLFPGYFLRIHGVESRHWLYLFSEEATGIKWKRVIFIGKDREGKLRRRWQGISLDPMIFIDMYPEKEVGGQGPGVRATNDENERVHVEEYQLSQLEQYGIMATKREIRRRRAPRVILYPEKGFEKEKWELENFVTLYGSLRSKGVQAQIMIPAGLQADVPGAISIDDLNDVRSFFETGGVFVSNDSGMAHLAGASGLFTITVFTDYDPRVWHPRGTNVSLKRGKDPVDCNVIETIILNVI